MADYPLLDPSKMSMMRGMAQRWARYDPPPEPQIQEEDPPEPASESPPVAQAPVPEELPPPPPPPPPPEPQVVKVVVELEGSGKVSVPQSVDPESIRTIVHAELYKNFLKFQKEVSGVEVRMKKLVREEIEKNKPPAPKEPEPLPDIKAIVREEVKGIKLPAPLHIQSPVDAAAVAAVVRAEVSKIKDSLVVEKPKVARSWEATPNRDKDGKLVSVTLKPR